jgi:hypothetical protein
MTIQTYKAAIVGRLEHNEIVLLADHLTALEEKEAKYEEIKARIKSIANCLRMRDERIQNCNDATGTHPIKEMINKELAGLIGLCWHEPLPHKGLDLTTPCICGSYNCNSAANPDFTSDPGKIELLRLMMKREDWSKFLFTINKVAGITVWGQNFIFVRYITDTTGLLAQAAVEWLTAQKEGVCKSQ